MQTIIYIIAQYFIFLIPLILIYYLYTHDNKRKASMEIILISVTSFSAWLIAHIIKNILKTSRPDIATDILMKNESIYAFPSGHTTLIFAVAAVLYFYHKKMAYAVALLGLAVGLSRVYIGVHYPIDVLGGIVLGITVGYAGYKTYIKYKKN